jgi:ornithine cyclodeaminase/alanine dehydrogenase-like protein (mu-crystallin family)
MKKGRTSEEEITVFDATGLAFEDIICARIIFQKAKDKPGYTWLKLVDG